MRERDQNEPRKKGDKNAKKLKKPFLVLFYSAADRKKMSIFETAEVLIHIIIIIIIIITTTSSSSSTTTIASITIITREGKLIEIEIKIDSLIDRCSGEVKRIPNAIILNLNPFVLLFHSTPLR